MKTIKYNTNHKVDTFKSFTADFHKYVIDNNIEVSRQLNNRMEVYIATPSFVYKVVHNEIELECLVAS